MTSASIMWNWASPAWLAAAAILATYLLLFRTATNWHPCQSVPGRRAVALLLSMALVVLAFVSPIGVLADGYLFSAHMVQHLVLLLLVPLLLLISLPRERVGQWFKHPRLWRACQWQAAPVIGWICGVGAMWFWHVPSMCSAAAQSPVLGGLRDVSLVAAGLAFWWPIFAPVEQCRLAPPVGIVYLFSACLGCTLLGIYITFTTVTVCPAFADPVDRLGIVNRLYDAGLTRAIDQHLGGLLMWVPPCTLYLCAILRLLCRWYSAVDDRPHRLPEVLLRVKSDS